MNYRIILDGAHHGELTRLFGVTQDVATFIAGNLVDSHTGFAGATLMAQGGDTGGSSSSSSSSSSGGSGNGGLHGIVICTDHHPCPATIIGHDPYLLFFGAGAAIGLVVGLAVGAMIGKSNKQVR
jgi:hypothetical protein